MADKEQKLVNGSEFYDADDADSLLEERTLIIDGEEDGVVDEEQTLTLDGGEVERLLLLREQEIQVLNGEKAELSGQVVVLRAGLEASEARTSSIASHASILEGEVTRLREELITAESACNDGQVEVVALQRALRDLEKIKALKIAELEGVISGLVEKIASLNAQRQEEIFALQKDMEIKLVAAEEKAAKEILALAQRASRERELEAAVKLLEDQITKLEEEIAVCRSEVTKSNLEVNSKDIGTSTVPDKSLGSHYSLPAIAGAIAVTAVVTVTATTFYLRHARQK